MFRFVEAFIDHVTGFFQEAQVTTVYSTYFELLPLKGNESYVIDVLQQMFV